MRGKRSAIRNEFSGRLFKTAVLTFTLLTIQATCLYFGSRTGRDQAPLDSIGNVVDHHNLRKLLEFNASSKPNKPVSPSYPETTEHPTEHHRHKECSGLRQLNSSEAKCQFVKSTDDCDMSEGFFQYLQFLYCSLPRPVPVAFVVLALWLIFLFIVLGTTADEYFCPSLTVISKTLGISQNVAGVTFLAYGNGAPDIFSALAAFTHSTSPDSFQLGIQALFGAGVFVTTVVVGVISFMPAFTLTSRPFIRDILFYLGAVAWAFITLHDQRIRLREAIGFIVLYVAYVLVVIVGHYVYQRWKRRIRIEIPGLESPTASVDSSIQWSDQHEDGGRSRMTSAAKGALSPYDRCDQNEHRAHSISEGLFSTERAVVAPAIHRDPDPDHQVSTGRQDSLLGEREPLLGGEPRPSAWRKFLQGLEPIDREEWSQSKILWKCFLICKAPAVFCLNLTLPVVDYDKENDNWNKWLNVLHCATVPVFCVMATKAGNLMIGGKFPAWALALCAGVILALIIAMTTRNDKQPRGHFLFAYLAFVASVIWIYSTANEIVNLLQTFGAVSGLSDAVLGLTFLAWGNSIGDFVSNTAMARQGFPRMAVSACFGGPLLNMLLGIGLSCTVVTISRGQAIRLPHRHHQYAISAGFLAASLSSSAIVIPLLGFRVPRMYGVFLIVLYIAYLTVSIVAEIKKI